MHLASPAYGGTHCSAWSYTPPQPPAELGAKAKGANTQAAIIDQCCACLDGAEATEIIGEVLFKATNGKYYTVTVEAVIGEASKEFVQDILDEDEKVDAEG